MTGGDGNSMSYVATKTILVRVFDILYQKREQRIPLEEIRTALPMELRHDQDEFEKKFKKAIQMLDAESGLFTLSTDQKEVVVKRMEEDAKQLSTSPHGICWEISNDVLKATMRRIDANKKLKKQKKAAPVEYKK